MNSKKNGWIKKSIIIAAVIIVSFLIECLGFNRHSIFHGSAAEVFVLDGTDKRVSVERDELLVPLEKEELENMELQKENEKIIAELNGEEYVEKIDESLIEQNGVLNRRVYRTAITIKLQDAAYIKKLTVDYPGEAKLGYGIELRNGEKEVKTVYDSLDPRLKKGVTNVGGMADTIVMSLSTSAEFTGAGVSVGMSNDFRINYCRLLYLIGGMLLTAFVLCSKKLLKDHVELVFAACALVFGSFIILYNGTNQMSWDEHIHYESAYRASFGPTIRMTEASIQMKGLVTPSYDTLEEKKLVADYTQERNDFEKADIKYQQRFIQYNMRAYLPQSVMIALARICRLPFSWAYMLGKLGNLLAYTCIMALAIRLSKTGKIYIAILGLMPTSLFLACSYAYDAFVTAFIFLGFVLWLNEIIEKDKKLTWYNALAMILCFVVGSWSKTIYIAMLLLLCFLPAGKFDGRLKSILFRTGTAVVVGLMLYAIVSPPVSADVNYEIQSNIKYFGDRRVADTSFTRQMSHILSDPFGYAGLLLKNLQGYFFDYTFGTSVWLLYAYVGRFPGIFALLTFGLIMAAGLLQVEEDRQYILEAKWKWLIGIMAFGMASLIWTGLYMTFTPVGADYINGVQGRYYIPFILPMMFILKNQRFRLKLDKIVFYKIIFGVILFINLFGTYVYFLKPFCF